MSRRHRPRFIPLFLTMLALPGLAAAQGHAEGDAGPLRGAYARVKVVVEGDLARTTVTQVFVNDLPQPIEATYGFPLPDGATVTGFAEWRDGRRVEARTEGKAVARATYEKAAARGERAALGEKEGGDRFRMSLFALPAGGSRKVQLSYVQTLSALGGERGFVFPRGGDRPAASVLDIEVDVDAGRDIETFEVPNQPDARVVGKGSRRVVRLSRGRAGLKQDLALRWRQDADDLDLAARAGRPETDSPACAERTDAFTCAHEAPTRPPRDLVLVVDTSISMAGAPLARARRLAHHALDLLTPADRVQLVVFAGDAEAALPGLTYARSEVVDRLRATLDGLEARGRSDLQAALKLTGAALAGSPDGVALLMTDGQPTATPGDDPFALDVDPTPFGEARVVLAQFTYPKGAGRLSAVLPNVTARFVPDGPAGDAALDGIARLAAAPTIEDLQVVLDGPAVYAAHGALPTRLALGEHVRLMARVDDDVWVRVTGTLHGEKVEVETMLHVPDAPDAEGDRGLPVEWARLRVADLEAELVGLNEAEQEVVATEIRALGTTYNLATRFTSYVLVDSLAPDRIKPGDPEIRVHAPEEARTVFGVLPWGEVVECTWQEDEGLWLGRFLVPRGTPDGLYRVRIFVETQAGTDYRGPLFFRVDSEPPPFALETDADGPVQSGDLLHLRAFPDEPAPKPGVDRVDRDPLDLKSVVVQVGDHVFELEQVGDAEVWEALVPVDLPPGAHALKLVAMDWARNTREATVTVEVE